MAVVGSVGSGKSSLLSALLGDMEKLAGQVRRVMREEEEMLMVLLLGRGKRQPGIRAPAGLDTERQAPG